MGDRVVPRAEDGLAPDRRLTAAGLSVREWGEADAPPLLFVHGLGTDAGSSVEAAAPVWSGRFGLRVVAPDIPGFGDSPPREVDAYLPSRLGELLMRVADELGLRAVALVGFSWGGTIAVQVAARQPDRLRGLALLESGYDERPRPARPDDDEIFAAARWGMGAEQQSATWPAIAAAGLPVLLLARDGLEPGALEPFRRAIPAAEVEVVAGAGHDLVGDAPEQTVARVGKWAARLSH